MLWTVRVWATLRERAGAEQVQVDLPQGECSVQELYAALRSQHPQLGALEHIALVAGTEYVRGERTLRVQEELSLLPPVSGGEADEESALRQGLFYLVSSRLDAAELARKVEHSSCGAVCVFTGHTRETNRGLRVVRLEYEAFAAMTGPEMGRIFERARAQRPEHALRMVVAHRVGVVEVGEPSVVVAVASPHRDAAFHICRYLIDELKQTLPIWKKEIYADGHHWIGERS